MKRNKWLVCIVSVIALFTVVLGGLGWYQLSCTGGGQPTNTDSPMLGGTPQRNMVNTIDKNLPVTWNTDEGKQKNIKWVAELGSKAFGGPVIAGGKVYVSTNNAKDKKGKEVWKAVLMAFNEADGRFLWQLAHESPDDPLFNEGRSSGLISTPVVEGQHLYYVTGGCEVVCASTAGKVMWKYDMMKELKVIPHHIGTCSPLIVDDLVMVVTGNGVDEEFKVPSPKAPSFIAVNKKTGKLAWQSNLPGNDIIEGQFSNPTLAVVGGKKQVIFPGGDCVLYSFEPDSGKLIWKCDCNPTRKKGEFDNYIVATPVVVGEQCFVGIGVYPENGLRPRIGYMLCVDITKKGDVSFKNFDAKSPANKNSALVWAFGGAIDPPPEKGRPAYMGPTPSTACVHDGLVFVPEDIGYLHCLDAKTGKRYWDHDFRASVWGSAYYVDGKVYIGTDEGEIMIFVHSKERKWYVDGKVRVPDGSKGDRQTSCGMGDRVHSTPVVANGVLYIQTDSKLYAIK